MANKNANKRVINKNVDKKNNEVIEEVNDLIAVEFIRSYTPYVKGEVAGVDERLARKLIEKDIAKKYIKK